uniref:Uncharacterized protein n=1 Tax=Glossina palpalis gambiensis TaxID=67801 RepID=A0A1B0AQ33_9MUSC
MKKNLPREFLSNKPTTTTSGHNQRTNQPSSKNNARITTTSITALSIVVDLNSSQQLFAAAVTQVLEVWGC